MKSFADISRELNTAVQTVPNVVKVLKEGFADIPSDQVKTSSDGSFETMTGGFLKSCNIKLVPIQSGSGDP